MKVNSLATTSTSQLDKAKQNGDKALQNIAALRALSGTDSANLAIADALLSQSTMLEQGIANANDAIGMLQIADSTLSNLSKSAERINELSVSLGNAALNSDQRSMIQNEIGVLKDSMEQSVSQASFNGRSVFGGELNFFTGNGTQSLNLNANAITGINKDGSNASEILDSINSLRSDIGSAQKGIAAGINASVAQSIALRQSESGLQNNDVAQNLSSFKQENLKINAALLAQSHNVASLQSQFDRLLA